jgi:site-specific DNA-methyltransferase (adenine-specific)
MERHEGERADGTEASPGPNGSGGEAAPLAISLGRSQVRLFNEDCIAGMARRLAPGSVSVVVTSPPYNLGIRYSRYDDTVARDEYLAWLGRWGAAVREALAEDGSLFLNVGSKPSDPWVPFQVATELGRHFRLQNVIHWVKSIAIEKEDVGDYPGITGNVAVGHFKPINSPRFLNDCHEYIFHFTKTGEVPLDRLAVGVEYQDKSNVTRWKGAGADRRCRGNTWFVPYATIKNRDAQRPHPATFPIELARKCIRLHGLTRSQLVLDPFLGIGHAGAAAVSLGLDFVGFEIDPEYFGEAVELIRRSVGWQPSLELEAQRNKETKKQREE